MVGPQGMLTKPQLCITSMQFSNSSSNPLMVVPMELLPKLRY